MTIAWTTADLTEPSVPSGSETLPAPGELVDSAEGAIDVATIVVDVFGGEVVSE